MDSSTEYSSTLGFKKHIYKTRPADFFKNSNLKLVAAIFYQI